MSGSCQGCGAPLAPNKGPGPARKWCSDKCRKATLYGQECEVCGRRDNGSEGRRDSYVCQECKYKAEYGERNRRIFEAWDRGETAPQIAKREGMTATAVGSLVHLHRLNGKKLRLHRHRNREQWSAIEHLWKEGKTGPEIAAALGTNEFCIYELVRQLRQRGIDLPLRSRGYDDEWRAEVVRLYRSGLSMAKVAAAAKCSTATVRRVVLDAGAGRSRSEAARHRKVAA